MEDSKVVTLVTGSQRAAALPPSSLALSIYNNLVNCELLEEFDLDAEVHEVDHLPVAPNERIIGTASEDERKVFTLELLVNDILQEYMHDRHANFAQEYAKIMADKSLSSDEQERQVMALTNKSQERQIVWQYHQSMNMLRMIWAYSIKQRLNEWGPTGIRVNWNIVTYDPAL